MLIQKCLRVIKNNGFGALGAKAVNRIKYKKRAALYIEQNAIDDEGLKHQASTIYPQNVLISIAVPLYNTPEDYLRQMIASVLNQSYKYWELCLADAGDDTTVEQIVAEYTAGDSRIKYQRLDRNYGIAKNTNLAVAMAEGDYIGLLDHDDVLAPNALFEYRKQIDKGSDFIYCNEASFTTDILKPVIIHFKPCFSPYNLRSNNYICHFSVFKKSLFDEVGGLREGFDGSQDHELILRLTEKAKRIANIDKVLYYWRIHKNSVAMDISAKPYCINSGVLAVSQQLLRLRLEGSVKAVRNGSAVYSCKYKVRSSPSCRTIKSCKNSLIKDCQTEFIAIVPSNIKLQKSDICHLISLAGVNNVGAVGGIGIYKNRVTSGAVRFDGENCMEIIFDNEYIKGGGYMQRLSYVQNVNALNLFAVIKRSVLEEIGGFDEALYQDERLIDLCLRLRDAGFDILLEPNTRAVAPPTKQLLSKAFCSKYALRLKTEDEYVTNNIANYSTSLS